jgi:hypothetical protein
LERSLHAALVQQIAGCHTVDNGEALLGACTEIYVSHQIEQTLIGMVSDGDRQRLFVEGLHIVVNDGIQQTAQPLLVRLVLAGIIEPLLKFAESLQPVVLLRKPRMQCVHGSLFK